MKALRARLTIAQRGDEGMGIIEVIVALAIFMIVSVGIAYSAISSLRLAADSESREVAANLAASEIDNVRAEPNPLNLLDKTRIVTVNGLDYTIFRKAGWVSASGSSSGCGVGTGALQYKQVDVQVTWTSKLERTSPVRSNTILAPEANSRLNDPSFGTILVSALAVAGTGSPDVTVTIVPVGGGAALAVKPTDFDGCSYAFKVPPGTYKVTLNKADYISSDQQSAPTVDLRVVAGGTHVAAFSFDEQVTFNLAYAPGASVPEYPSNLQTSFISTYGAYGITGGPVRSIALHPFSGGYSAVAGAYVAPKPAADGNPEVVGCLSPAPSSWPEATVGGVALAAGQPSPNVAGLPGDKNVNMSVPMGVISLNYTGPKKRFFVATSIEPEAGSGAPGCATGMKYIFAVSTKKNTNYKLALPYGTWSLATANNAAGTQDIKSVVGSLIGTLLGSPAATPATFTLDPRVAK